MALATYQCKPPTTFWKAIEGNVKDSLMENFDLNFMFEKIGFKRVRCTLSGIFDIITGTTAGKLQYHGYWRKAENPLPAWAIPFLRVPDKTSCPICLSLLSFNIVLSQTIGPLNIIIKRVKGLGIEIILNVVTNGAAAPAQPFIINNVELIYSSL